MGFVVKIALFEMIVYTPFLQLNTIFLLSDIPPRSPKRSECSETEPGGFTVADPNIYQLCFDLPIHITSLLLPALCISSFQVGCKTSPHHHTRGTTLSKWCSNPV